VRGRPKKYASDEERKAAHAAAKQDKRKRQKETRGRRREAQRQRRLAAMPRFEPTGALALRIQLHRAIDEHEPKEVIAELYDEVARAEEMEEYDAQVARQTAREQKVRLDPMNRGLYMPDAPQGKGLILFSAHLEPRRLKKRFARPIGFGSKQHEEHKGGHDLEHEMLSFVNKHFHWTSALKCYRPRCGYLVVGILPQDHEKPRDRRRFHCYLHSPIQEFRGH